MGDSSIVAYCLDCHWRGPGRQGREAAWRDHDRHLTEWGSLHRVRVDAAVKVPARA